MLKLRALSRFLDRFRTGGVNSIMIFSTEGVLITHSSADAGNVKTTAAIIANVWNLYQKNLQMTESETLQEVVVGLTNGKLVFINVASTIICISGSVEISMGLLRAKASHLAEVLNEALSSLAASDD